MTTGNKIVDEISVLHINSIPEAWYRTVVRNNQPHAMAILILWDLVYWYKWTEVRDEASGMVVSYKKKFKADLLQRSYDAIASKFGITKRQATDIIVFLEKLGALKRVFTNIKVANTTLSNVLFIELVPNVIKDLSHVELGEVSRFDGRGSHVDSGEGLTDSGETYTTSSTTNTTTNINSSPNKSESEPFPEYTPTTNKTKKPTKTELNKQFLSSLTDNVRNLSEKCVDLMIDYLTPILPYNPAVNKISWQADIVRRARDKNVSLEVVLKCIQFVHDDSFERPLNMSPEKLFKRLDCIFAKAVEKERNSGPKKSVYQQKREAATSRVTMNTNPENYNASEW